MRLTIAAVGRLAPGPERELVEDYAERAGAAGRAVGIGPVGITEIDDRKARTSGEQGARLIAALPKGSAVLALDERGKALSSPAFADLLGGLRDAGRPDAVFLIGGAEGHPEAVRARADRLIGLGPMVWPHRLARAMLAEQLYRAVSILAGTPYHRG